MGHAEKIVVLVRHIVSLRSLREHYESIVNALIQCHTVNKTVLKDAGIDPETIYDMQLNGEWTWDAWVDIMKEVQRDTDNDGQNDVFGCVRMPRQT